MDYDKFIEFIELKYIPKPIVSSTTINNISWVFQQELAEMTKDINYQCNFDKSGLCRIQRMKKKIKEKTNSKCCCKHCYNTFGYLNAVPDSKNSSIEKEIISLFDETNGFWREGKGCILPRKYRSSTCLLYMCDAWKVYKVLPQKERIVLYVLGNPKQYYPDYVKLLKRRKIRSVNDFIDTML